VRYSVIVLVKLRWVGWVEEVGIPSIQTAIHVRLFVILGYVLVKIAEQGF
jgi:hypothetical protein